MRTVVGTRKLTTKIRFMSDNQQIFRISDENSDDMEYKDIAPLLAIAENIIDEFDVVLLVDYNKGMMIPKLISQVIKVAKEKGVGVISDIKYRNVGYYEGSLIIKCNHKEYEAITYRPSSKYWIVTHGKAPTLMIHGGAQLKIDTIGNPYFKNSNCAGDIYMAGFVNSFVNTIQTDFKGQESACIHYSIKQGNKLASKSLSKVKDKVV
jgi:sugar/nucleoside kinase (ribokinase family)